MFHEHTQDSILNVINSKFFSIEDFDMEYFLYSASSCGCIKILQNLKEHITQNMLTNLLSEAISTEYEAKCEIVTAKFLLKEFGTENFELTHKRLRIIKKIQLKNLITILFPSDENIPLEYWNYLFEDVDEFNKVVEDFCSDKFFKNMPLDFRHRLLNMMLQRKLYLKINLNNSDIFKNFAKKYNYYF